MKFKSTVYEYDRLLLEIDIITLCNYHCWYCYSRKRKNLWNKIMSLDNIKMIAKRVKEYKGKVDINLLGGEPLMHPRLDTILKIFSELNNVNEITITSNGSHDKTSVISKYPNVKMNISYHASEVEFSHFLEILEMYNNIGKLNVVTVMMDEDYSKDIKDLIRIKDNYPCTLFEQHYPIIDGEFYNIYENDSKDDFEKIFQIDDSEPITYDEVVRNKLNRFKGCRCEIKRVGIQIDGSVKENCKYTRDKNIFKNYTLADRYMICDMPECLEYVTLQMRKTRIERYCSG